ncbi:hypothetical protein PCANC_27069 [Puccinia coronata f. sp. avenae]|nr:hypothetical protein PCANC_27069 [Puccinia coronata f. sp. avenae]
MEDAQYLSPLIPNFPEYSISGSWPEESLLALDSFDEISEANLKNLKTFREGAECIDVEMLDLTPSSEHMLHHISDFEMYEATEHFWSLNLDDNHAPWTTNDIYMVDVWLDDSDDMMSP